MDKDKTNTRSLFISKPAIIDKNGGKHAISEKIGRLLIQKGDGDVTEQDIKLALKEYNLRDTLTLIGNFSRYIFHKNQKELGKIGYHEESTNILITQFALAYIANILILSGADNSSNINFIDDKYSFLTLCNIYSNKLINPDQLKARAENKKFDNDDLISFMVRMWYEQMSNFQVSQIYSMARSIVFFCDLVETVIPTKTDKLSDIFLRENGITIEEYMKIGFGFFSGSQDRIIFENAYLSKSDIPYFKSIFTEKKVNSFLNITSTDYDEFRNMDRIVNKSLDPVFTKNRFNPLFSFPLIKEEFNLRIVYIMPNIPAYVYRVYTGIYWWFHNYFEKTGGDKKLHLHFRTYFGSIFEQYVGIILKDIYGIKNVYPELVYSKKSNQFTDWHIVRGGKCYLFEAKAYQFALLSRQTGELETIIKSELKKVVEAIIEIFRNINDIEIYEELAGLRGKTIIPIIVFLEIPLVSSSLYKEKIKTLLTDAEEKDDSLKGLKGFKYYLLNIEELEMYGEIKNKIEIEDIFDNIQYDGSQGFISFATKINGSQPGNKYLDKVYDDFWGKYLNK